MDWLLFQHVCTIIIAFTVIPYCMYVFIFKFGVLIVKMALSPEELENMMKKIWS